MYPIPCSQLLRMSSRLPWLYTEKEIVRLFENLLKSNRLLKIEKNAFSFEILKETAFLNPNNLRKRQKERLQTFLTATIDGLLSRQAKIIFFKGIFQRFKGFKCGPRFQKLLSPIFEASFWENRGSWETKVTENWNSSWAWTRVCKTMISKNYDTRSQAIQTWLLLKFYENSVFLTTRSALCPNSLEKFLFKVNRQDSKNNF